MRDSSSSSQRREATTSFPQSTALDRLPGQSELQSAVVFVFSTCPISSLFYTAVTTLHTIYWTFLTSSMLIPRSLSPIYGYCVSPSSTTPQISSLQSLSCSATAASTEYSYNVRITMQNTERRTSSSFSLP